MKTLIYNAKVVTPFRVMTNAHILIENGTIIAVGRGGLPEDEAIRRINAHGLTATPGFIDLHTHGAGGCEYMDGTPEAMLTAARTASAHGTTTLLPTSATSSDEALFKMFDAFKKVNAFNHDGAELYGFHLEGPFFSMAMKGAQDPRYVCAPEREHYERIMDACPRLTRWSAAPELCGAMSFGRAMSAHGIVAAIGHTDCNYDTAVEAYENGYSLCTHFYNAMSSIHKNGLFRECGAVEAAYNTAGYDVEIIADGVHQPMPVLRMCYERKGASRMALITDSLAAAGLDVADGTEIMLGGENGARVVIEDNVAKLADRSAIAGSVATSDRLLRVAVDAGIPFVAAIEMMTATPARIAGMDKKGVIAPGRDADIVLLDGDFNVHAVYKKGMQIRAFFDWAKTH